MTFETIVTIAVGLLIACTVGLIIFRRRPRKLKVDRFERRWQELQKLLADQDTWKDAIIRADDLLDEALKKRRFRGGTMGERLVKAQRVFSDNDSLWYGHKLRKRLDQEDVKLKQNDVKEALIGIKQALKDLGAL